MSNNKKIPLEYIVRESQVRTKRPPVIFMLHGYGSNEERTIEEAENFKKQESGKIEVIEFKKNNNDNDFYDTNNANIDSSFNGNPNNTEMNHKNRTIQKFVARSIGGGLVSLILGVFTANIVLILLGAGLTGGGAFLAVKNKDKIKWK